MHRTANPHAIQPSQWAELTSAVVLLLAFLAGFTTTGRAGSLETVLPAGVRAVWDMDLAWREATSTRERLCLNGLWRWQPSGSAASSVPDEGWGFFKVPGAWPGITDYMQKDAQRVFVHPAWTNTSPGQVRAAWYERTFVVPPNWNGRRIALSIESLNSHAAVFVDGRPLGEIRFPGGELDLTAACRPGARCRLSLLVTALPLQGVTLSYTDSAAAREVKGAVPRRGLCGDVFLVGTPAGSRIGDVRVNPSVRRKRLEIDARLLDLDPKARYSLRARVHQDGEPPREFGSPAFGLDGLTDGRFGFAVDWLPDRLWDIPTPGNLSRLELALLRDDGHTVDVAWPVPFGFREFWIEGRDFYLNGSRIFLSAVPLDNAQVSAAHASYAGARESLERLQSFGINFVYTHNYDCTPGAHLGFEEILRAADDVGMLVGFSLPHFSQYDWTSPEADRTNGYLRHAEHYVRAAQNHPSVVLYAMSHNATGYDEDMNPHLMDGRQEARDNWARRNAARAERAEAIARRLDPGRIVYHHASGNLGSMHAVNFYPNFVPIQELSDWFGHWATDGIKPLFLCEYGAPFTWDWTMYRGWFEGRREFGSARVPWEFCLAEWNAQFLGDQAYDISPAERANLRWEAARYRAGDRWHRWDYPHPVGSTRFAERYPVFARYLTDNWRAFRTWGVSALSPWEHEHFWKLRDGVDRGRVELAVDWERLQRPGFSPDFLGPRYERMDLAFERSDWAPTAAADALLRNNRPLLAWISGRADRFTSKDHTFLPGETVEKQIVLLNNSRRTVTGTAAWTFGLPQPMQGERTFVVATGQAERIPVRVELPSSLAPGRYPLAATIRFDDGDVQRDMFMVDVLPTPPRPPAAPVLALFDPRGETGALLDRLGVRFRSVPAHAEVKESEILVIGKAALTAEGPGPDLRRVRDGSKVIVFEQPARVLERRLGFRVQEYGLRQVFARVPDHPILRGLTAEHLQDWRGEATLTPARLDYQLRPQHGPTVQWCGLPVSRAWRCGNRGNVASVLIEKPARGDFLPLLDGGFSLQYSPLLEFREGRGLVVFCQLDVTGRTEPDPAADLIVRQLLAHVADWKPPTRHPLVYVGEEAGRTHLRGAGFEVHSFDAAALSPDHLLAVGPGAAPTLSAHEAVLARWRKGGGRAIGLGLGRREIEALGLSGVEVREEEHIAAVFAPLPAGSPMAGIGPADVHNRDPRPLPLLAAGAERLGDGVLGWTPDQATLFCQMVPWQFPSTNAWNVKRTHRRVAYLTTRLLANLGAVSSTPLLERFERPIDPVKPEPRWLSGLYLDTPEEWDDPYRFFRW